MEGCNEKVNDSLFKNGTWRLVDPLASVNIIGCKWDYKIKYKVDGSLDNYKPRLVAKGYAQKEDVDYIKKFAPTTKWGTIRTLFSLVAHNSYNIHYMEVKTTFLNVDFKEEFICFSFKVWLLKVKRKMYVSW